MSAFDPKRTLNDPLRGRLALLSGFVTFEHLRGRVQSLRQTAHTVQALRNTRIFEVIALGCQMA
jgi:hypothetical protein